MRGQNGSSMGEEAHRPWGSMPVGCVEEGPPTWERRHDVHGKETTAMGEEARRC